ncbi:hypothetical protein Pmani_011317 [Petrolisthes manimaculis]|uniref:Carbonic anhydrase n=1 Tax=Petrolisthes manimaculis TaxID=1843537 RepID=A0AAE1PZP3_9EUCA|nr:hypothetical protein Pmani_011317 [Petrolisthes manimaculis]
MRRYLLLLLCVHLGHRVWVEGSEWSYDDVESWSVSNPVCGGERQSPVDLVHFTSFTPQHFTFINYDQLIDTRLVNTGHSLNVLLESLPLEKRPRVSGGNLPATYVLDAFHFHWGSRRHQGSEHLLAGCPFDGEMHLVHFKQEYGSVSEALRYEDGLAVLGVWLLEEEDGDQDDEGQHTYFKMDKKNVNEEERRPTAHTHTLPHWNPALTPTTPTSHNNTARQLGLLTPTSPTVQHAHPTINLKHLLPSDIHTFYRYEGSLTTPPCTENVMWTVFEEPLVAPLEFIQGLRTLVMPVPHAPDTNQQHQEEGTTVGGGSISDNFRPPQPLGDRMIYYSGDVDDRKTISCATTTTTTTTTTATTKGHQNKCLVFPPVVVVVVAVVGPKKRNEEAEVEVEGKSEVVEVVSNERSDEEYYPQQSHFQHQVQQQHQHLNKHQQHLHSQHQQHLDSQQHHHKLQHHHHLQQHHQKLQLQQHQFHQQQHHQQELKLQQQQQQHSQQQQQHSQQQQQHSQQQHSQQQHSQQQQHHQSEFKCRLGSPLDLHLRDAEVLASPRISWKRIGDCDAVSVANDGQVLRVRYSPVSPQWELVGGDLDKTFLLGEIVLRWGSEHHLAGFSFPLEVQLLHYNAQYKNLKEAMTVKKGVVVVAKLFQEPVGVWGRLQWMEHEGWGHNNALHSIINTIHTHGQMREAGSSSVVTSPDLIKLLGHVDSYYQYRGTLPDAPCNTPATWMVLRKVGEVSQRQISLLKSLRNLNNAAITTNPRPVRPAADRRVLLRVGSHQMEHEFKSLLSLVKREISQPDMEQPNINPQASSDDKEEELQKELELEKEDMWEEELEEEDEDVLEEEEDV